jgi:TRAP-type mannitol/chloroaromatic compound transport system permease large subunit
MTGILRAAVTVMNQTLCGALTTQGHLQGSSAVGVFSSILIAALNRRLTMTVMNEAVVTMTDVYRGMYPFVALQVIGLALCIYFPSISCGCHAWPASSTRDRCCGPPCCPARGL